MRKDHLENMDQKEQLAVGRFLDTLDRISDDLRRASGRIDEYREIVGMDRLRGESPAAPLVRLDDLTPDMIGTAERVAHTIAMAIANLGLGDLTLQAHAAQVAFSKQAEQ